MLYYPDSQDLVEGQKQHPIEYEELKKIKAAPGLTKGETIHCLKYALLCVKNNWSLEESARRIGVSKEDCLKICNCKLPFKDIHQDELYKTTQIKITTLRLNEEADILYEARIIRFQEIEKEYAYAKKPPLMRTTLLGKRIPCFSSRTIPNYGLAFKGWRAAHRETQYSIPDKILLWYEKRAGLPFAKRDCWHNFEITNTLNKQASAAFYNTFGQTVEQVTAPFLEYLRLNGISGQEKFKQAINEIELLQRTYTLIA